MSLAAPFAIRQRVYYQHTDAGGIVFHGHYLAFMEAARTEFLHALGFDLTELAAREAVMFIVRGARLEFARPGRLNDLLTVTAEVARVGRASLDFRQDVLADRPAHGPELLVRGAVELGCVHPGTLRPVALPGSIRTSLGQPE